MFHKGFSMSNLSTPTRLGRGIMVPGIDTKPFDKTSTAWSYAGLHTPPQSAHESRRPSLQYSTLSDAPYSATATSFAYSQPATPVHMIHQQHDTFANRPDNAATHNGMATDFMSHHTSPFHEHSLQSTYQHQSVCTSGSAHGLPSFIQAEPGGLDLFGLQANHVPTTNAWSPVHQVTTGLISQSTCLGSDLFPTPIALPSDVRGSMSASLEAQPSICGMDSSFDAPVIASYHGFGTQPHFAYQQPQVVVPSQLSPHDGYMHHQASDCASFQHNHDAFQGSFALSSASLGEFEAVDPPSPMEAYFEPSDDEGYLSIKPELASSPSYGSQGSRSRGKGSLAKRRSKLPRQRGTRPRECWSVHWSGNTQVRFEGTRFPMPETCPGPDDRIVKVEIASSKKPHVCPHKDDNGRRCGSRFDRSEHLKRHQQKHTDERKYPCPLAGLGCTKAIGRPDNAGDHFKTHLRPDKKGKRNKHCSWEDLQREIWTNYEDKKAAKKLLDNLGRWVKNGMPETAGNKRMSQL